MQEVSFLFSLVLLLFFGRALGLLLRKGGQQELIGEVIAGFILGVGGFIVLSVPLDTISQFGILMIMLLAGLTTDFNSFKEQRKTSILVGALGVLSSFVLIFFPLYFLFKVDIWASLFIAAILSNTAIEICASVLMNTDVPRKLKSVVMGASFVDDIIAVFLIGIVSTMVFSNISTGPDTLEYETDFSDGTNGWFPYNYNNDTKQCYPMEITTVQTGDGDFVKYHLYPPGENASFILVRQIRLTDSEVEDERSLQSIRFEVHMAEETDIHPLASSGSIPPTDLEFFHQMARVGSREYELEVDQGVALIEGMDLYFALGIPLDGTNQTNISIQSISITLELAHEDDKINLLNADVLQEFFWVSLWIIIFLVGSLFFITRLLDRFFDRLVLQGRFFLLTFTLIFAFAFAMLARGVGLHEVIGVYLAGLIIGQAGSKVKPLLKRQIAYQKLIDDIDPPLRSIFGPLFFGYIGVTLGVAIKSGWGDFSFVTFILLIVVLSLLAFAAKILGCGICAKMSKFSNNDSVLVGIAMCGRGALEFVLLSFGLASGIINNLQFSALVVVTLLTVLLTPVLFTLANKRLKDRTGD
jgi:Kef-type K+ transport system membrane component KefB